MPPARATYGRSALLVLRDLVREDVLSTTFDDILVRGTPCFNPSSHHPLTKESNLSSVDERIRNEGYVPGPRMKARVIGSLVNAWKGHNIVLDRELEIVTITDQGRRRLAIESASAPLTHEVVSRERLALLRIIRKIQSVVDSDANTQNVGSTTTCLSSAEIADYTKLVPKIDKLIRRLDRHRKKIHDLTETVMELHQAIGTPPTDDGRNRPLKQEALKQEGM
ncbi:hypothetical protein B0H21DRAFT_824575 [Amylocystis lapponica]|nr:hypothetical protein B0H21DRAFT_824575 [Amylocystis lapponica]